MELSFQKLNHESVSNISWDHSFTLFKLISALSAYPTLIQTWEQDIKQIIDHP